MTDSEEDHELSPSLWANGHQLKGAYRINVFPSSAKSNSQKKKHRLLWGVFNKLEFFRDGQVWTLVNRVFSRGSNDYHEVILDAETLEVRRETVEPLDEHRGHGSAKPMPGTASSTDPM